VELGQQCRTASDNVTSDSGYTDQIEKWFISSTCRLTSTFSGSDCEQRCAPLVTTDGSTERQIRE
jgi:hypothetical protein